MKKQGVNPYLPLNEYIPDAEPYVFGERLYVFGSHDKFNGWIFCLNDYVCYSAPIDDLSDWRYEGVIYRKNQDPRNKRGLHLLFAPDVTQGIDGRFYLYYAFDFMGIMGVAVSDKPQGPYEFYGHVQYSNGTLWGRKKGDELPFDPGVLVDEDQRIYLYSGFYKEVPALLTGMNKLKASGGVVLELLPDMITIKESPKLLFPRQGSGSYKDHEFFEGSSIRKYDGKYYFVYSSKHNHELCYAVSDSPTEGFRFGGTLISQGDLFLDGRVEERDGLNYLGNTHGGLVKIENDYFIFYHRQTNRHSYSRQACAEKLTLTDGGFKQAEVTSCGLNKGPLRGRGWYEAGIACNIMSKEGVGRYDQRFSKQRFKNAPYLTQEGKEQLETSTFYVANMKEGSLVGYKYFELERLSMVTLVIRGIGRGSVHLATDRLFTSMLGTVEVKVSDKKRWVVHSITCSAKSGICGLYFKYCGEGYIDLKEFELI